MPKIYRLSKQEIGEAIVRHIGVFYEKGTFFPYKIAGTDEKIKLPETITFSLDFIPRGTKIGDKEAEHAL